MSVYKPMDTEAQALTGRIKIFIEYSDEWTNDVFEEHLNGIKKEFDRLNEMPVTEFTPSVWDNLVDTRFSEQFYCVSGRAIVATKDEVQIQ